MRLTVRRELLGALSPRELIVLALREEGQTVQAIARILRVSKRTVIRCNFKIRASGITTRLSGDSSVTSRVTAVSPDKRLSPFAVLPYGEEDGANRAPARRRPSSSELARIRSSYRDALRQLGLKRGGLRPHELAAARSAARENALAAWPGDSLAREFAVQVRALREAGYEWTLRAAINHAGEKWGGNGEGAGPVVPAFDGAAYRRELEAIAGRPVSR